MMPESFVIKNLVEHPLFVAVARTALASSEKAGFVASF